MVNYHEFIGQKSHRIVSLIICWDKQKNIYLTTLKCGQTFFRQNFKSIHLYGYSSFLKLGHKNQDKRLLTDEIHYHPYINDYFEGQSDVDTMMRDLNIGHISDIWIQNEHNFIIRDPLERFAAGLVESISPFINDYIPNTSKYDIDWEKYFSGPKSIIDQRVFDDTHLLPWLSFVNLIYNNNTNFIDLKDINKYLPSLPKEKSNSNLNLYSSIFEGNKGGVWQDYLLRYLPIFQNEMLLYQKFTTL